MKLRQLKYNRVTVFFSHLKFLLLKNFYKKIIIGASGRGLKGYLKTEEKYFNVLDYKSWMQVGELYSIVAEGVWEHLTDPQVATNLAWLSLSVGGELLLAVPDHTEEMDRSVEFGHLWHFSESELVGMLRKAGFKMVEVLGNDNRIKASCKERCLIIRGIK